MRLQRGIAVQARNRQQVQDQGGDLQEPEERYCGPEDLVLRLEEDSGGCQQDHGEDEVGERSGEIHQGPLPRGHEARAQVHRPAREPDPTQGDEQQRQTQGQQRVGVLQRVEREIAPRGGVLVTEAERRVGMSELVQAQRHQPAADDEDENADTAGRTGGLRSGPGQHPARGGHGDEREEHRAGAHRLAQRANAHATNVPVAGFLTCVHRHCLHRSR
jgi:hypothetical protein